MPEKEDVQRYADIIMAMIKEDQDSGQVPQDAASWDELDNVQQHRFTESIQRMNDTFVAILREHDVEMPTINADRRVNLDITVDASQPEEEDD